MFLFLQGGQWTVQGPLVLEACHAIGMTLEKGVMQWLMVINGLICYSHFGLYPFRDNRIKG